MRQRPLKWMTGIVSMTLAFFVVAPMAHANPPADPTPTSVEQTIPTSELPTQSQKLLREAGVLGGELTIEQRGNLAMVDDGDAWAVMQLSTEGGTSPLSFSIGICHGAFFDTIKVGSNLEWGAQNNCVTTDPNDVYPHRISSQIRIGRYLGGVVMEPRYTASSASHHEFNLTVTANGIRSCVSTATYKYDTVVYVTVHGTQFGPKVSNEVSHACDIG